MQLLLTAPFGCIIHKFGGCIIPIVDAYPIRLEHSIDTNIEALVPYITIIVVTATIVVIATAGTARKGGTNANTHSSNINAIGTPAGISGHAGRRAEFDVAHLVNPRIIRHLLTRARMDLSHIDHHGPHIGEARQPRLAGIHAEVDAADLIQLGVHLKARAEAATVGSALGVVAYEVFVAFGFAGGVSLEEARLAYLLGDGSAGPIA